MIADSTNYTRVQIILFYVIVYRIIYTVCDICVNLL